MAIIALYSSKINQMPNVIEDAKRVNGKKIKDGCKKVVEWCQENWESICNIILTVVAVVAVIALSIVTFGAGAVGAVLIAATVGAIVGFCGAVGGVLMLTGNAVLACSADSALFSMGFEKLTAKLSKSLVSLFPKLRRLTGKGSYEASYKMILTKLTRRQIEHISFKTIRNGVISGLVGDFLKNVTGGFNDGFKELYTEHRQSLQN